MTPKFCLQLPFLRGPLPDSAASPALFPALFPACPAALRLWPGLPVPDANALAGYYCPPDYPFSPAEAAACLEDLRQMDAAALSGLALGATVSANAQAGRLLGELAGLDDLTALAGPTAAREAEAARRRLLERQQAQKALLWLWLQEERLAELARLAEGFSQNARALAATLTEDVSTASDDGMPATDLQALTPGFLGAELRLDPTDPALVPPWRLAVLNAACFLPPEAAILAEGPMRDDILERLPFRTAAEAAPLAHQALPPLLARLLGCQEDEAARMLVAEAPLWQALGQRSPAMTAPLYELLCTPRLWLALPQPGSGDTPRDAA